MTIEQILQTAYEDTNTSTANYPYTKGLKKLNEIYKEIYRMINSIDENYFWNYWTTDIQTWATEYDIQRDAITVEPEDPEDDPVIIPWIEKIIKVEILEWENYVLLPQLDSKQVDDWVKWWYLADNHIILNFRPQEDIEDWLRLYWTERIPDLLSTDDESAIFPWHKELSDFYWVLYEWLNKELWKQKQDFEKHNFSKQEYLEKKEAMRRYITERVQRIYYTNLEY